MPNVLLGSSLLSFFIMFLFMLNNNMLGFIFSFATAITCIVYSRKARRQNINNEAEANKDRLNELITINDLNPSQIFYNDMKSSCSIIDEDKQLLVLFNKDKDNFVTNLIPFSSLFESSIVEDGDSIMKTSRSSQLGGALVGGFVAGGVGAIVGGLSASRKTITEVKSLKLQVVSDDLSNPIQHIEFFKLEFPIKKENPFYIDNYNKALHWHKLISILIKRQ